MARTKVALIGAGRRAQSAHLPVLSQLKDRLDFVAVCDNNPETAGSVGETYRVRSYTDVRELVARENPEICTVTVPADAHHVISCYLSNEGVHQLIETPIAPTLALADLIIETAEKSGVVVEVSENIPCLPVEQMSIQVIRSGAIGRVGRIYRLFCVNGYHGSAVICDKAGALPKRVRSVQHEFPVEPYIDRMQRKFDKESFDFAVFEFSNNIMGIWMCGNKNGALGRNKLAAMEIDASRGVIITGGSQGSSGGEEVRITRDQALQQGAMAESFAFQREFQVVNETRIVRRIWAALPDGIVEWINPFADLALTEAQTSVACMYDSILNAVNQKTSLIYTPERARTDMMVLTGIRHSILHDGAAIDLPLEETGEEKAETRRRYIQNYGTEPFDLGGLLEYSFPRV